MREDGMHTDPSKPGAALTTARAGGATVSTPGTGAMRGGQVVLSLTALLCLVCSGGEGVEAAPRGKSATVKTTSPPPSEPVAQPAAEVAPKPPPPENGVVTYISNLRAGNVAKMGVYIDHGRDRGLSKGASLPVFRAGKEIGKLELTEVSDHRAVAKIIAAEVPLKVGDELNLAPAPASAPAPERKLAYTPVAEDSLATGWTQALAQTPHEQVAFDSAHKATGFEVQYGGETSIQAAMDLSVPMLTRAEQNLALWAEASDGGTRGLDVRIRADFELRYDALTDQFLAGQRAYPLVQEVSVRYAPPGSHLALTVGRVKPTVRKADRVDGVNAVWQGPGYEVLGYVGLTPTMMSLAPQPGRPSLGAGLAYHPWKLAEKLWNGQVSYGLDLANGGLARMTLASDNHVSLDRLKLNQAITVDYLPLHAAAGRQYGIDVSEFYLGASYPLASLELGGNLRMNGRALLQADADQLPEAWAEAMSERRLLHADVGARLTRAGEGWIRPYLFWQEDDHQDEVAARVAGIGAAWHGSSGGARVPDLFVEYGDGTRQQATLMASLNGPVMHDQLHMSAGLVNFWSFTHETGVHAFQHLATARLDGEILERVNLWTTLMGGIDYSLTTGPVMPVPVMMAELGAAARW